MRMHVLKAAVGFSFLRSSMCQFKSIPTALAAIKRHHPALSMPTPLKALQPRSVLFHAAAGAAASQAIAR